MKTLAYTVLASLLTLPFTANANTQTACASFFNDSNKPLVITTANRSYNVDSQRRSILFNQADGAKYNLLDGQVTVWLGQPQITKNANFSIQFENHDIPVGYSCEVNYLIRVYH